MCQSCSKHVEINRDASNHAAGNPLVVIGTAKARESESGSIKLVALRSEDIPDDLAFLKMALRAKETGALQGGDE